MWPPPLAYSVYTNNCLYLLQFWIKENGDICGYMKFCYLLCFTLIHHPNYNLETRKRKQCFVSLACSPFPTPPRSCPTPPPLPLPWSRSQIQDLLFQSPSMVPNRLTDESLAITSYKDWSSKMFVVIGRRWWGRNATGATTSIHNNMASIWKDGSFLLWGGLIPFFVWAKFCKVLKSSISLAFPNILVWCRWLYPSLMLQFDEDYVWS